jgi:hypothetical protein
LPACIVCQTRWCANGLLQITRKDSYENFSSILEIDLVQNEDGDWYIDSTRTELGRALTCFLSPIDALVESAHLMKRGQLCHIAAASAVKRSLFRDVDGRGLIANIHLGWPSLDRGILARPGGEFSRCCRLMNHWAIDSAGFTVDRFVLAQYSRFRELAGLYAWQEAARDSWGWTGARRRSIAGRAVELIEVMHGEPKDCRQLALFDPEFEQWHFVPYTKAT